MNKQIRISRHGVPAYVAPWFKALTKEGQHMIGQNNIMLPYNKRCMSLTKMDYKPRMTNAEFCAQYEPNICPHCGDIDRLPMPADACAPLGRCTGCSSFAIAAE